MKILCIGRNYEEHARELNNPVPTERPVVFMKPATAMLINNKPFYYPEFTKDLHYEGEIVLKVAKNGRHVQPEFAREYYEEVAFGIDFTARDLQSELKQKGHPWELAKAFDGSAVLSEFIPISDLPDPTAIEFQLIKNGTVAQHGNTRNVIFSFDAIICFVSKFFKLQMGDYIFTGTPAGVGPVQVGDLLEGVIFTNGGPKKMLRCEIK